MTARWRWGIVILAMMVATTGTASAGTVAPPYDEGRTTCVVFVGSLFFGTGGCPASRKTLLGHAASDARAEVEAGRLSVDDSAGGSPVTIGAEANSAAMVIATRTSAAGGVVRATLTGISGGTVVRCPSCVSGVEGASASVGVVISVGWSVGGETRSSLVTCSLSFDGSPAPASIVIPDGCQPDRSISVPPGASVTVAVALDAGVGVSGRGRASASMEATVREIEIP